MCSGEGPTHPVRRLTDLPAPLLQALLSPGPPDRRSCKAARRAAAATPADWRELAAEAQRQGIGLLVYQRLCDLALDGEVLDSENAAAWRSNARHAELQTCLQRRDAVKVHRVFDRACIPHAFLKGFVYRESLYRPTWVRAGADIDILVDRRDVEMARSAMHYAGFAQASRSNDFRDFRRATRQTIEETEAQHHELAQFAKTFLLKNPPAWLFEPAFARDAPFTFELLPDGPVLHSVFDVHWALHFIFADTRPLEALVTLSSREADLDIPALSAEWNLLFTSFKLYFESFDRLGWGMHLLVDLVALLHAHHKEFDWDWYQAQVAHYGFEAMSFYTLSAAERLAGARYVPESLFQSWSEFRRPARRRDRERSSKPDLDFGDFAPFMLGYRVPCGIFHPPCY